MPLIAERLPFGTVLISFLSNTVLRNNKREPHANNYALNSCYDQQMLWPKRGSQDEILQPLML
jgi:hypothetical protein